MIQNKPPTRLPTVFFALSEGVIILIPSLFETYRTFPVSSNTSAGFILLYAKLNLICAISLPFFIFTISKFLKVCFKSSLIGFKTYSLICVLLYFSGISNFFLKSSILKILYPVSLNNINSLYNSFEYLLLREANSSS